MRATEGIDLRKVVLSTPAARLITYSLLDGYRLILTHERRHLAQAARVLEADGFPSAA